MLALVMSPPLGNTISEATIPLSVTIIMSQFASLPQASDECKMGIAMGLLKLIGLLKA